MPSSPQDRAWRLRAFRPGDETGLGELLERGLGQDLGERTWRWKLKGRASPVENVWLAVDRAGKPIFHYGGMPRALTLAGERLDVMVAVDAVTDPAFRRRGILTAGASTAHRAWAAAGFACVLGLPNEQWGTRVQALGWRPLFPLRWSIRPLRPERLLAERLKLPAFGRLALLGRWWSLVWDRRPDPAIEVREVERIEGELDAFWQECRSEDRLMLARDREWLEWRYSSCPLHRYRIIVAESTERLVGYLVYRFDGESRYGFIAELLAGSAAAGRALLDAALGRLARRGAVGVAALAVPGSELHRALRRSGFLLSWGAFHVHCVPLADDLPLAALRDPRRWWMQGGDFDVI